MRAAGIFMAVAAGNDGPSCSSIRYPPAISDAAFTVGGTEVGDTIRPTSSRGPVRRRGLRLDLSGAVTDLEVEASGGALLQIGGLKLTTARVDLSGGVVATMSVSSSLTGTASGGVVVNLDQRPATVAVETSGGAVVLGS